MSKSVQFYEILTSAIPMLCKYFNTFVRGVITEKSNKNHVEAFINQNHVNQVLKTFNHIPIKNVFCLDFIEVFTFQISNILKSASSQVPTRANYLSLVVLWVNWSINHWSGHGEKKIVVKSYRINLI